MKLRHLCVLMFTGCAVEATVGQGEADVQSSSDEALAAFTVDSSALAVRPAKPALLKALRPEKLEVQNVASKLLRATQSPAMVRSGTRTQYRVVDWELETDPKAGRVLANRAVATAARAVPQDVQRLRTDSLSRLRDLGVDDGEVGTVLQREVMASTQEQTSGISSTELHSYKTFVFRSVNGIPVEGHRAVITHARDGSMRKALMTWPALAGAGHQLTSRLERSTIETRAKRALLREGETAGSAKLAWRYVPVPTDSGEVTLKLVAIAAVAGRTATDGTTAEPRIVEVDVDAE